MKDIKFFKSFLLSAFVFVNSAAFVLAADHGDAPGVRLDNRFDINDVYIFQSPSNAANTVLIMTTNPVAGITGALTFNPDGFYEFLIDNNSDAKPDSIFSIRFTQANKDGIQRISLNKKNGAGKKASKIANGTTETDLSVKGGGAVRAGLFDDPFFFDLLGFRNGLQFCTNNARNFFRGLNTMAIVLELPTAALEAAGSPKFGVWARTIQISKKNRGGTTIIKRGQFDRMGRPAINTVLVNKPNKDKFNKAQPVNDKRDFEPDAVAIIASLGNAAGAQALGDILFPDILTFDASAASAFPNGRKLSDDVIDVELQLITGNKDASDCVANDSSFADTFPYLAGKNP